MFTTIPDPVDDAIIIIRDDSTGFYNVTNALIQMMVCYSIKSKNIGLWITSALGKELIELIDVDRPFYTVRDANANNGTYIHPTLYIACMSWASAKYYLKSISFNVKQ